MKLFVKSRARLLRILRYRIMKWTHNFPPSLCVPSRGACWPPHGRWWQWVRPLTRQTQSRWPLPPPALKISSWAEGGRNRNMFLIYDVKHQFKDINSPQLQIIANSKQHSFFRYIIPMCHTHDPPHMLPRFGMRETCLSEGVLPAGADNNGHKKINTNIVICVKHCKRMHL